MSLCSNRVNWMYPLIWSCFLGVLGFGTVALSGTSGSWRIAISWGLSCWAPLQTPYSCGFMCVLYPPTRGETWGAVLYFSLLLICASGEHEVSPQLLCYLVINHRVCCSPMNLSILASAWTNRSLQISWSFQLADISSLVVVIVLNNSSPFPMIIGVFK